MAKQNGFLQLRRGIFEHVREGRMSHMDALIFIYIMAQADTRTGVWKGSAGALAGELGVSPRTARGVMERLSQRGYIRRFPVPGKHSCYPILIHKFLITDGEHRGEHLNARDSIDYAALRYLTSEERVEDYGEHSVGHSAAQKRIETIEARNKNTPPAKLCSPPLDSRFEAFFGFAYRAYETKNGQGPTWGGKDRENLRHFLKEQSRITLPEWNRRFTNYLASNEAFIQKQGHALGYFTSHFDAFRDGPILEKGGINGAYKNNPSKMPGDPGKYQDVKIHRFSNGH